jgi:hypothetical protein
MERTPRHILGVCGLKTLFGLVCGLFGFLQLAVVPAWSASCQQIIDQLSRLDLSAAQELRPSSKSAVTYKELFDECDKNNTFGGRRLPRLQGMRQLCSNDPNSVKYIRRFSDGTVVLNAKMSVDADGSPVSAGPNASPSDQPMTWLEFDRRSERHFVNSEDVPYVVVPTDFARAGISFQRDTGLDQGDLALVIRGDKCSVGVVGDSGPYFRIGEASLRAHADLGNPQCAVSGQYPCRKLVAGGTGRSIPTDVTYILFPGTRPKPLLSQTVIDVASISGSRRAIDFLAAHERTADAAKGDARARVVPASYVPDRRRLSWK